MRVVLGGFFSLLRICVCVDVKSYRCLGSIGGCKGKMMMMMTWSEVIVRVLSSA